MHRQIKDLLQPCIEISKQAGERILELYKSNINLKVELKQDATPVTIADYAAHQLISEKLNELTPETPILSEEAANIDFSVRKQWQDYWLIDPLDGTKEFINQTDEFTVNIAYVRNHHAILGVIYAPVFNTLYYACEHFGAYKQDTDGEIKTIQTRKCFPETILATVSRRHSIGKAKEFLEKLPAHQILTKGSSLKTCVIAEGLADVYPCLGKTSEWDMGAAQCIIEQAGGMMMDLNGKPIRFNEKASLLNPPLLVVGDSKYNWEQFL